MPIQERAQRTRRRVLVAAAGVFAQRGFARASMAEILDAAGVTKGALYFHFPGKEALAKAVVQEQFQNPGFAALDGDGADGDAEAGDPGEDGGSGPAPNHRSTCRRVTAACRPWWTPRTPSPAG